MKDIFQHVITAFQQRNQPASSRIASPRESEPSVASHDRDDPASDSREEQFNAARKTIAEVATAVWRAKSKLDADPDAELPGELRKLPRYIRSAWEALEAGKVQVDDPRGRPYVPGMAVNTLTIQPTDGIAVETIHETIKPTVYFYDKLIQRADVIIASPMCETGQNTGGDKGTKEQDSGDHDMPAIRKD